MVTRVYTWAWWRCWNISISAQSKQDLCSHVGPRLGSQLTRLRNTHRVTSMTILWNATLSLYKFLQGYLQTNRHSVESPSMVDPQWNIWYWGSKWNLHTVCWSAVACEWGTTSVYFGITYVCSIPSRLPVFAVEPQYLLQYIFYFCQKYH